MKTCLALTLLSLLMAACASTIADAGSAPADDARRGEGSVRAARADR
jgi:hypothetical protein